MYGRHIQKDRHVVSFCVTFVSFRIIKVPKYSSCIKHDCLVRNYCKLMSESYAEVSDEEAKQKYVGYCKEVA
jgi:hypothetical protein